MCDYEKCGYTLDLKSCECVDNCDQVGCQKHLKKCEVCEIRCLPGHSCECKNCDGCNKKVKELIRHDGQFYCYSCASKRGLKECGTCHKWKKEGIILEKTKKFQCKSCSAKPIRYEN